MEIQQLDILEERITRAIDLIGQLKSENEELKGRVIEIEGESQSKQRLIEQLKEENQGLRLLHNEASLGKEKQEKIRSKVEQMLSKLDELQEL